jgi:hypothetical protein
MACMHGQARAHTHTPTQHKHTHTHIHTHTCQTCLKYDVDFTNRWTVSNEIKFTSHINCNFVFRIILSYFIQWPLTASTDSITIAEQTLKELGV